MTQRDYDILHDKGSAPVKAWVQGVPFDNSAQQQLRDMARLPFIHRWIAAMPDVHAGKGATIGSIIPTRGAIIPAAVGVDIGCGMNAVRLSLRAEDLPDHLRAVRGAIEKVIPVGNAQHKTPLDSTRTQGFAEGLKAIVARHPKVQPRDASKWAHQMGTLGSGNHFIELCLDENDDVWVMLHSGSRGIGNIIGSYFIEQAKREMERYFISLPNKDLAYLSEDTTLFDDYIRAVHWAQDYAMENRHQMMQATLAALRQHLPAFTVTQEAINCHHNYVEQEHHYNANVWVTRKGAIRARDGDLGIIPGSMGARSYIVRGKGNAESFCSCSHGAGRAMTRTEAKRRFSVADHEQATQGVECRKDAAVIDETPMAYKNIESVMQAQQSLVDVVHVLRQVVCVKG